MHKNHAEFGEYCYMLRRIKEGGNSGDVTNKGTVMKNVASEIILN